MAGVSGKSRIGPGYYHYHQKVTAGTVDKTEAGDYYQDYQFRRK